jgi:hypothetical protein
MNFESIHTLEIPQEATELTFNELKLICGGSGEECGGKSDKGKEKKKFVFNCNNNENKNENENEDDK